MASLSRDASGYRVQFFVDGKRYGIRITAKKQAEAFQRRVEILDEAKRLGQSLDAETADWVAKLGDDAAALLAQAGLIRQRTTTLLGPYLDEYLARRTDLKPNTVRNLQVCGRRLVEFFGEGRDLRTITRGDADAWVIHLRQKWADGTVGRTVGRAKQLFRAAVRSEMIASNPFADAKAPPQVNRDRDFFVGRELIAKVIDACPNAEWRLIVALCRFGGLRCPSELLPLRWSDVDWDRGRFLVHSPKTEHHPGGESRWVPIFPELRPFLNAAWDALGDAAGEFVIARYRRTNANLATQLKRFIHRAGEKPWPKLFQNMRATRETELARDYPRHVACAWIGNSESVAQKHYLQVTDDDFKRAAEASKLGAILVHQVENRPENGAVSVQSPLDGVCQEATQPFMDEQVLQVLARVVKMWQGRPVPLVGLEPTTR